MRAGSTGRSSASCDGEGDAYPPGDGRHVLDRTRRRGALCGNGLHRRRFDSQISATVLVSPERLLLEVDDASLLLDPAQVSLSLADTTTAASRSRPALRERMAGRGADLRAGRRRRLPRTSRGAWPPPLRAAAKSLHGRRRASSAVGGCWSRPRRRPAVGLGLTIRFSDALVARAVAGVPLSWEIAIGESAFLGATAGLPQRRPPTPPLSTRSSRGSSARRTHGLPFAWKVVGVPQVNAFAFRGKIVSSPAGQGGGPARRSPGSGARDRARRAAAQPAEDVRGAGIRAVPACCSGTRGAAGAIGAAGPTQELSYGRDQEREADLAAIDLLDRAGIDPRDSRIFDRLAARRAEATPRPAPGRRFRCSRPHRRARSAARLCAAGSPSWARGLMRPLGS